MTCNKMEGDKFVVEIRAQDALTPLGATSTNRRSVKERT
jgi:hypothetical protein